MNQSDKAYSKICEMITQGKIRKEMPIFEKDLTERFGMSRTPIREAIQKLIAEGTLEHIPRRGFFVKTLNRKEIINSYLASEGLEGMVSYLVAEKRSSKDVEKMKFLLAKMEEYTKNGDNESWAETDEALHNLNYSICDNDYITDALYKINIQVHRIRFLISKVMLDKEKSNNDHKLVIDAIEKKDSDEARTAAFRHMKRVRIEVIKVMDMGIF